MDVAEIKSRPLTIASLGFLVVFVVTAFGIGSAVGGINGSIERNTKAVEKLSEIAESLRAITVDHEARIKAMEREMRGGNK